MTHNAVHVEVEVVILLAIRIRTSNVNRYRYYAAVFSSDLGFVHLIYRAYYESICELRIGMRTQQTNQFSGTFC